MLDLAVHIVQTKRGEFAPQKFEDHYENAPNELLRKNRMPLVLDQRDHVRRLSEGPDPQDLRRPCPAEPMRMWPIPTRVNKL
jgi:hypothetical protein